jgi:Cu(I)/Ag(I) efflux system membrane fusion protein
MKRGYAAGDTMLLRVVRFGAVFTALCALAACDSNKASRAAVEPTPSVPQIVKQSDGAEVIELRLSDLPGATVAVVHDVALPATLEANGQVTFDDRRVAAIISRVTGRIEDITITQWDTVRRGQPILSLYSPDFMTAEAEYLESKSNSRIAPAQAGPLSVNFEQAAVRKLELLGLLPEDIRNIKTPSPSVWMRAPTSGVVVDKKAVRGAQVNPGDELFSVATLDEVWVTASIYEDDLARVRVGQALAAVTTAFPDQTFNGTISRISPNIDPNTHTLEIRCQVKNPGGLLKPEMLARVKILTQPGEALVVPQTALVFDIDAYYAFVQTNENQMERHKVAVASWNEQGYARVVSGLKSGDRVVNAESVQLNALWHQARGESS